MKAYLKIFLLLVLGLLCGYLAFWQFTKTHFYSKLAQGDSTIIQEAIPLLYVTDPQVGMRMLPHTKIHFSSSTFDSTVITNADGFTGRDYPLQTNHYRIAIMGDSAVEAYGVADNARFPQMTETLVYRKSAGQLKVDIMGFGVSSWGQVNHYGAIKKYVLKYKPNEIWLMFLPSNNTGSNTPLLNPPPNGPTFIYKNANSNEIVDIQFGYTDTPDAVEAERKQRYGEKQLLDISRIWSNGLLPYYWSTEHNPQWDLIEGQTIQTLKLIKNLCDKNHIKLTVVYRVTAYEEPGEFEKYKKETAAFLKHDLPMDESVGVNHFRKKLQAMGIGFIDLHEMKTKGILSHSDEAISVPHLEMAEFLSDKIIQRLKNTPAKTSQN